MKPETEQTYKERMLRVLVHIQERLDEALTLEELARVAHFSPYHFHRVFRGMVGESVAEHTRRLRLERAALRLKSGDQPITQLAFEAGYEAHEAFTRAFGAMFGRSPSDFRKAHQAVPLPQAACGVHFAPDATLDDFEPLAGDHPMNVRIEHRPATRVAFMRHTGPYDQVGATWGRLCGWAGPRGLLGPQTVFLALCHDDPEVTPPDRIRYDACLTVGDDFQPQGDIGVQTIPEGDYAMTVHEGPYETLKNTYAALCGQWLPTANRELRAAPSIEVYLNDPNATPPQDLRTEVHVPLEP